VTTLVTSMPSARASIGGHLEVHDIAGVVLDDMQDPGAAVDGLGGFQHLVWSGGVNTAPGQAASSMP